ncbi:PilZ domain-containing protein [Desulfatibacillum aliphaticivorans]|uniref:PilZ domain-containing protein n=1 Tax=Desulfatibacillum aliphaticivorans TaxID=218208 RepID=UPI00041E0C3A|nr:PilZ domain-containing protein [Desulfatibacillum aliphaticivorans]
MNDFNGDRRKFPRFSKTISVDINGKIFPVSEKLEHEAEGKDISVSGLSFSSPSRYDVGAKLSLAFRITNSEADDDQTGVTISRASNPISCKVEVVRNDKDDESGGYRVGVKFIDIAGDDYRVLIRHLAKD